MANKLTIYLKEEIKEIYVTSYPPITIAELSKRFRVGLVNLQHICAKEEWRKIREEKQSAYIRETHKIRFSEEELQEIQTGITTEDDVVKKAIEERPILEKIALNRYRAAELMHRQLESVANWQKRNKGNEEPKDLLLITQVIEKAGGMIAKTLGDDIQAKEKENVVIELKPAVGNDNAEVED